MNRCQAPLRKLTSGIAITFVMVWTAGLSAGAEVGLGFAEPSNSARFVVDRLRTYGWVRPSWIGVKLQQVTPEIAASKGMVRPEGSIVSWVLPSGPAHKAGLEIGDVILRFNPSFLLSKDANI
jgi:S1-C subfamily serine protease